MATNAEQIYRLIEYLLKGTATRYQGFLQTLAETNQCFVANQILEANIPEPVDSTWVRDRLNSQRASMTQR